MPRSIFHTAVLFPAKTIVKKMRGKADRGVLVAPRVNILTQT